MVRKVDKTKLLTVVGIIIFLFGGAVRIFSHLTSSADNYIENFDVIIFSGLIIGWGVSVAYRIVQKNIRICLVISAALMLLWMALRAIKYNSPADINTYGRYLWYSYYIAMVFLPLMMFFAMLNIGKLKNFTMTCDPPRTVITHEPTVEQKADVECGSQTVGLSLPQAAALSPSRSFLSIWMQYDHSTSIAFLLTEKSAAFVSRCGSACQDTGSGRIQHVSGGR